MQVTETGRENIQTSAMASVSYSEDLVCSICLSIFSDPVTLLCGHSFCRQCITGVLDTTHQCPHCQAAISTKGKSLPTSYILRSLAEKAKGAGQRNKEPGQDKTEAAELCPEHEEKLKLFCVTDQQLACIICRDSESHEGHKFKPIKEAAASLRKELEAGIENLRGDIVATGSLANTQKESMTKCKEKSQQLMTQIHRQFEEMHQFLRKREDEIKNELKNKEQDAVEEMSCALKAMEAALSESRELEVKVASVLEIEELERFLKSWTEGNNTMTPEHLFRSRAKKLKVVNSSVSLQPYESHLQFFMWKEMLQVIQPRAELLSLKTSSSQVTLSDDGQSLFYTPRGSQHKASSFGTPTSTYGQTDGFGQFEYDTFGMLQPKYFSKRESAMPLETTHAFSVDGFSSGQHYWEIDVGHRSFWELGIKNYYLKWDGNTYSTCSQKRMTNLALTNRPRKIGIYLDCSSSKLLFYDADRMTRMHTMSVGLMARPVLAYFNIDSRSTNTNPVTVCWYGAPVTGAEAF